MLPRKKILYFVGEVTRKCDKIKEGRPKPSATMEFPTNYGSNPLGRRDFLQITVATDTGRQRRATTTSIGTRGRRRNLVTESHPETRTKSRNIKTQLRVLTNKTTDPENYGGGFRRESATGSYPTAATESNNRGYGFTRRTVSLKETQGKNKAFRVRGCEGIEGAAEAATLQAKGRWLPAYNREALFIFLKVRHAEV